MDPVEIELHVHSIELTRSEIIHRLVAEVNELMNCEKMVTDHLSLRRHLIDQMDQFTYPQLADDIPGMLLSFLEYFNRCAEEGEMPVFSLSFPESDFMKEFHGAGPIEENQKLLDEAAAVGLGGGEDYKCIVETLRQQQLDRLRCYMKVLTSDGQITVLKVGSSEEPESVQTTEVDTGEKRKIIEKTIVVKPVDKKFAEAKFRLQRCC